MTSCCSKPNIAVMDYTHHPLDDFWNPVAMVNRVCLKCLKHWAGPKGEVKEYTRQEWDALINSAFDEGKS